MHSEINNIKELFDKEYQRNSTKDFIKTDPIQIPHLYSQKKDIEIMGFLASVLAFGSRKAFVPKLYEINDIIFKITPSKFVDNFNKDKHYELFDNFVYRHFSNQNLIDYLNFLNHLYSNYGGFYPVVCQEFDKNNDYKFAISKLRKIFIESNPKSKSSVNHFGNIDIGSACKKLNMFFRWMIRKDDVDFGIWELPKSKLYIPLDTHVLNNSLSFKILNRKTADFKSATEITNFLRLLDSQDPIKYDFALFGLTANPL